MKPRLSQITPGTAAGQVATTVNSGGVLVAVWQAPPAVSVPLFSDAGASPLVAEDGSDYLYPN